MTFGKRSSRSEHVSTPIPPNIAEQSTYSGEALKLVIGIVGAVGLFFLAIAGLRQYESHLDETFGDAPHQAALRQASRNTSAASERLRNKCPIPQTGARIGRPGSFRQKVIDDLEYDLVMHAKYLDCVMREERPRLCNAAARSELIELLQGYSNLQRSIVVWRKNVPQSHFDNVLEKLRSSKKQKESRKRGFENMDREILKGLNDLILAGYVIPSRDFTGFFGPGVPKQFRGKLIDPIPGRNPCK
ncbi:MAG: hypothetical protein RIC14_05280 [Filomicrobium sp.]